MSEVLGFDSNKAFDEQVMQWTVAGHEVIVERGTFRMKKYLKNLSANTPVMVCETGAEPHQLLGVGDHRIVVGDLLPERADLCLDEEGTLISQSDFIDRYVEYINWHKMVEGSDPGSEHIPNVKTYVAQIPDTFSESPGYVTVGYDARKPAPSDPTHQYDSTKDEMVEIKSNVNLTLEGIQALLEERKTRLEAEAQGVAVRRGPGRPRKTEV